VTGRQASKDFIIRSPLVQESFRERRLVCICCLCKITAMVGWIKKFTREMVKVNENRHAKCHFLTSPVNSWMESGFAIARQAMHSLRNPLS
jgi:hypothetical protein